MTVQHERQQSPEIAITPELVLLDGQAFLERFGINIDPNADEKELEKKGLITINPYEEPERFELALREINPRYKEGRHIVRSALEKDHTTWDNDTRKIIKSTAEKYEILSTEVDENEKPINPETPLKGHYKVAIALGAQPNATLDRVRYAAEAARSWQANFDYFIVAGSLKVLDEKALKEAAHFAPSAKTEFDLCVAAAGIVAQENPGLPVAVQCIGREKSNTPEIINEVLGVLQARGLLEEGDAIAAITTQIYRISTELDLARTAKQYGITETFVAGNPSDPEKVAARTDSTYVTEIIRTLRAATETIKVEKVAGAATPEKFIGRAALAAAAVLKKESRILARYADGSRLERDDRGSTYLHLPRGGSELVYSAISGVTHRALPEE